MGKIKVPSNVDLENSSIGGVLKQIRKGNEYVGLDYVPKMTLVWVCSISPSQTKNMVTFIEKYIRPVDESDFTHAKRFMKITEDLRVLLRVLLCSTKVPYIEDELLQLLRQNFDESFEKIELYKIPAERPMTKEQALKWSAEYWPLSWKGNPNHQDLITARFDLEREHAIIKKLINTAGESKGFPVGTILADRDATTGEIKILHIATDNRQHHPLHHSVMNVIGQCAEAEREKRKDGNTKLGYLCHELLVYTTHEPCAMCAMALVHSRIGRLIYVWPHVQGGIELSHFIGDRTDLNWTFEIWRWIGPGSETTLQMPETQKP